MNVLTWIYEFLRSAFGFKTEIALTDDVLNEAITKYISYKILLIMLMFAANDIATIYNQNFVDNKMIVEKEVVMRMANFFCLSTTRYVGNTEIKVETVKVNIVKDQLQKINGDILYNTALFAVIAKIKAATQLVPVVLSLDELRILDKELRKDDSFQGRNYCKIFKFSGDNLYAVLNNKLDINVINIDAILQNVDLTFSQVYSRFIIPKTYGENPDFKNACKYIEEYINHVQNKGGHLDEMRRNFESIKNGINLKLEDEQFKFFDGFLHDLHKLFKHEYGKILASWGHSECIDELYRPESNFIVEFYRNKLKPLLKENTCGLLSEANLNTLKTTINQKMLIGHSLEVFSDNGDKIPGNSVFKPIFHYFNEATYFNYELFASDIRNFAGFLKTSLDTIPIADLFGNPHFLYVSRLYYYFQFLRLQVDLKIESKKIILSNEYRDWQFSSMRSRANNLIIANGLFVFNMRLPAAGFLNLFDNIFLDKYVTHLKLVLYQKNLQAY
jgi:hypothetical protein